MARPRQPVQLVVAKGAKHLSKSEINLRLAEEVQPCADEILAPSYLTAQQKKQFYKIADQLQKLELLGETDCETLARYVTAEALYESAVKELRRLAKDRPKEEDFAEREDFFRVMALWYDAQETADKRQDRYFKQAHTAASALGLTISSRCKLIVPNRDEEPKVNKFAKFGKAVGEE